MEHEKMYDQGFDHPCRETCSGWKQGKERGEFNSKKEIEELRFALGVISKVPVLADKVRLIITLENVKDLALKTLDKNGDER